METVDELEARYLRDMAKRYGDAVPAYRMAWEAYQDLKRRSKMEKKQRGDTQKTAKGKHVECRDGGKTNDN